MGDADTTSLFGGHDDAARPLFGDGMAAVQRPAFAGTGRDTRVWTFASRTPADEPFRLHRGPAPEATAEERIAEALAAQRRGFDTAWEAHKRAHECAMAEAESEAAEAVDAAYAAGAADGRETAASVVDAARRQLAETMGHFADTTRALVRRYKTEAAELAIELARAVVGRTLELDRRALEEVVERAMAAVPRTDEVVLRCHPDDLPVIEAMGPALQAGRSDPLHVRLVANPAMEPCGCIIEFADGAIDARPSVALDMLAEAVRSTMSSVTTGPGDPGRVPLTGVRRILPAEATGDDQDSDEQENA